MSWCAYLYRIPKEYRSIGDIPEGFKPPPIGTREMVIASIAELFPEADFSDPGWFVLHSKEARAEIILFTDPVDSIALRGPSQNVIDTLSKRFDCRAIDESTGDFMDVEFDVEGDGTNGSPS